MIHMKTATVRDLRTNFPRLEAWLQEGESIAITKRKKVVAQLVAPARPKKPDFKRRFGGPVPPHAGTRISVVAILDEDRGA